MLRVTQMGNRSAPATQILGHQRTPITQNLGDQSSLITRKKGILGDRSALITRKREFLVTGALQSHKTRVTRSESDL